MAEKSTEQTAMPIAARLPHHCSGCDARWNGFSTCHCAACHRMFTGLTAFDKHRGGKHADDTRHCVDPESAGLVHADRAYPCWGFPNDGSWAGPETAA